MKAGGFTYYNTKNERIAYVAPCEENKRLNVFLAGCTVPNPHYLVCQSESIPEELNRYQFEYVTGGAGYIEVDGRKHRVEKGDLFFFNKGCPRLYYTDREQLLEKKFITANGTLLDLLAASYGITDNLIICRTDAGTLMQGALDALENLEKIGKTEAFNQVAVTLHRLIQLLAAERTPAGHVPYSDTAESIRAYIDYHLNRRFTLADIAEAHYLSKCQIIRLFKAKYGITPAQYAIAMRIEKSKYLLKNSRLSIRAISDALAFSDGRHFSKTFSAACGITPAQYRRLHNPEALPVPSPVSKSAKRSKPRKTPLD